MGLDAVELVMEIEEAFDIEFSDATASRIYTVGDVFDYIIEANRGKLSSRDICLSAATFYRIRRAVCTRLGLDRKAVRPAIALDSNFPSNRRLEDWCAVQTALNLKLPALVRPAWIVWIATALSIAASTWVGFLAYRGAGVGGALIACMAALITTGLLAAEFTSPFQTEFPSAFDTYRRLSHAVLARNYAALSEQYNSWNPNDIWEALKLIIVEQLGVRPEIIKRETNFVNDLGMD